MRNICSRRRQQGFVSILTVIFFMIFVSLITVGYLSIVINDQRRTIDNDLSASALDAAHSGIEEGKRILLYCHNTPSATGCDDAVNGTDCSVFQNGTAKALADSLGITINSDGQGVIGGGNGNEYQQYFTCLTITSRTEYATGTATAAKDYVQQLKTVSPFTSLKVSWSATAGTFVNRPQVTGSGWLTYDSWASAQYMPVLQVELIPYTAALFSNLDALEAGTHTVYLVPSCGSTACSSDTNINSVDVRSPVGDTRVTNAPIIHASSSNCQPNPGAESGYACSVTLTGLDSSTQQYYLRASVLYAQSTTVTLTPEQSNGTPALFDGVQPWIDATGRTNDVYRRVRAQVSYADQSISLPKNALDSAAPICKDMTVTDSAASSTYNCGN